MLPVVKSNRGRFYVPERPCLGEENKSLDLPVLLSSNVCADQRTLIFQTCLKAYVHKQQRTGMYRSFPLYRLLTW